MAESTRIDELRKRLEKEPGSRLFAQLAEELRKDGQLEEAIHVARAGLQAHPTYISARMTLGRALLDTGDLSNARGEFETVLRGAPDNILASRFLGECLEGLGDLGAALLQYKSTLRLVPGDRAIEAQIRNLEDRLTSATVPRAAPPPATAPPAPTVPGSALPGSPAAQTAAPPRAAAPPPALESNFDLEAPFDAEADTLRPQARPPAETLAREEAPTRPGVPPTPGEAPATVPGTGAPGAGEPFASATLAELYFNQGSLDRAVEVYKELLRREPANDRIRARLAELEAIDRHLRPEAAPAIQGAPAGPAAARPLAPAFDAPPLPPSDVPGALASGASGVRAIDPRLQKRLALERTIARLEGFLAAVKRA